MQLAPWLVRNLKGDLMIVFKPYTGAVPVPVLKSHILMVRKYDHQDGGFNPLNPMDAYYYTLEKLNNLALNKVSNPKIQDFASYLTAALFGFFSDFFEEKVNPLREKEARAAEAFPVYHENTMHHSDYQLNGVVRDTLSLLSEKDQRILLAYAHSEENNPTERPSIEIAAEQLKMPRSTYCDALKLAMAHFRRTPLKTFHVRGMNI